MFFKTVRTENMITTNVKIIDCKQANIDKE